jgi:transposase-like protein
MARSKKTSKGLRRRHTPEFKREALALAEKIGVSEAAARLKLQNS